MKISAITALCIILIPSLTKAQEETSQKSGYYQVYGIEALVRFKGMAVPIQSANKRGIFVESGKGLKRLPWSTPCQTQPQISISKRLVAVENYGYSYFYQGESSWESDAYNSVTYSQQRSNMAIASIGTPGVPLTTSQQEQVDSIRSQQQNYESQIDTLIQDDELKAEGFADSVRIGMTLTPNVDIPDAYCAVLTDFSKIDGERSAIAKIHWIGDLLKDIPEQISITLRLREGDYSQSNSRFFLFSGNSKLVPTTLSNGLKELSVDEINALLERAN